MIKMLKPRVAAADLRRVKPEPKRGAAIYDSPEWRALVRKIIDERGRRCEDPDHPAELPRQGVRVYADHIVELRDGGAELDERNVLLRCARCHGRKTSAERARRARRHC